MPALRRHSYLSLPHEYYIHNKCLQREAEKYVTPLSRGWRFSQPAGLSWTFLLPGGAILQLVAPWLQASALLVHRADQSGADRPHSTVSPCESDWR